ncbi:MAG: RHS repeat-associated core domain-containing protein [Fimbriimonadales bacterium]
MAKSPLLRSYCFRSTSVLSVGLLVANSGFGTMANILSLASSYPPGPPVKTAADHAWPTVNRSDTAGVLPSPAGQRVNGTLLNEVGRMPPQVGMDQVRRWQSELRTEGIAKERAAWLNLWLGETWLGREEPDESEAYFARACALGKGGSAEGLARYDLALARFYEGMYEESRHEIRVLMKSRLGGFNRRNAAMMASHGAACAGYHQSHSELGIPEPTRLDPFCGVAGLAVYSRAAGLRFDRKFLADRVPHHGMGSSAEDILQGCRNLGLSGHAVTADETGLCFLPKPLVAHVERDHFVALTRADRNGVTYICSDCGPWPGGEVQLTWKEWRALEPDVYVVPTKKGSVEDRALSFLGSKKLAERQELYATIAPQSHLNGAGAQLKNLISALETHVTTWVFPILIACGWKPDSGHCLPCYPLHSGDCPTFSPARSPHGSSSGDPVNLATGEEEYSPAPDMVVYNPIGPSVVWRRIYNSLGNYTSGFGAGWSTPYNVAVEDTPLPQPPRHGPPPASGGGGLSQPLSCYLVLENGAMVSFGTNLPTASSPHQVCNIGPGLPFRAVCDYDPASGGHIYTVTFSDRSQWKTLPTGFITGPGSSTEVTLHPVSTMTDRLGHGLRFEFSASSTWNNDVYTLVSRISKIDDANGVPLLTLGADVNNNIISASDRYGRSVYYHIAQVSGVNIGQGYQQVYPLVDQVSQIVPTGTSSPPARYVHSYQLYSNQEGAEMLPYLHTISVPSPTGSGMSTTTINYDSMGYVSTIVDSNGNTSQFINNANGVMNQTEVDVKNPQGAVVYKTLAQYNSYMEETQRINAAGQTVYSVAYGAANTPYRPSSITDGNNRTWTYTWDTFSSILTKTTPKGTVTTYSRSYTNFPLGELTQVQQGTKTATTFSYYEPSGLIQTVSTPIPGQSGTGSTQSTTCTWDTLGNLTQVSSPGNNATTAHTVSYGYTTDGGYNQPEALGEPITVTDSLGKVTHLRFDSQANLLSSTDPLGNQEQATYDNANNILSVTFPATGNSGSGRSEEDATYLYTGGPVTQVAARSENGTIFRAINLAYGQEGEVLYQSGNTESESATYDPLYRLWTLKDGNNNSTTYQYDLSGRLTSIYYPGATGGTYDQLFFTSYDPVNNLLSRTDGNGQVTNYTYGDTDGRLTQVAYPGNTGQNIGISYDSYDRVIGITDATGSSSTSFDDLGDATASTRTYIGVPVQSFSYTYYPDDSRNTMVNPAGTWSYLYDADGRYTSMTSPAGTSGASYLDNGWEQSRNLPNGVITTYTRNALGLLTDLKNQATGPLLSEYNQFSYDGVFNPTGLTASVTGVSSQSGATGWQYDSLDRITQEQSARLGGYTQTFASDPVDNLTTFKGSAQTFNSDNQQTGAGFVYDGNGNPTTYKGTSLGFDVGNRLASLGSSWTAGYRADGLRGWKTNSGGTIYYLYDRGEPVYEVNASGSITAMNVFAPDGLVARYSGGWTYYTFDAQGNVSQRLDSSQNGVSSSVYDAFGAETTSGTTPTDSFGYNAQWGYLLDRDTGLYLCRHRYYDPGSGRWVTRDPVGYRGGIGLYAYCGNGPVGSSDPRGLDNPGEDTAIVIEEAEINGDIDSNVADKAFEDALRGGGDRGGGGIGGAARTGSKILAGAGGAAATLEGVDPDAPDQASELCENVVQAAQNTYENLLSQAQENYPGKAGILENHHDVPQYVGGAVNWPTTQIDAAYHQEITNAFRRLWDYGQKWPDEDRLHDILKEVYDQWPLPSHVPQGFR